MYEVSVIAPSYNEEENIEILVNYFETFRKKHPDYELIIVDDGSTDRTKEIAESFLNGRDWMQLVSYYPNKGKTNAVLEGAKAARADVVAIYDADMQYKLEDLPRLYKHIEEGYDIVTGWKQGNYTKKFVSSVYNKLSQWIFHLPIHDQNGLKILKKNILFEIPLRKEWHRYIVSMAVEKGYKVCEEKVELRPRMHGESKYRGWGRIIVGVMDMISVRLFISLVKKPMLIFGSLGSLSFISGIIIGIIAFYLRFIKHAGFRPLLYLVMLLILSGILLFTVGFLAELLSLIYEELKELKNDKNR